MTEATPTSAPITGTAVLYRAALGPLNVDHYLKVFAGFDAAGRRRPVWHGPAALCTLGWLVLRRLWGLAVAYVLLWCGLAGLGLLAWPLLAGWPSGVRYGVLGFALLCWWIWPGWWAHALLHRRVQQRIFRTVAAASTLAEAKARLAAGGVDANRLRRVVTVLGLLLSGLLFLGAWQPWQPASAPPRDPPRTLSVPLVPAPARVAAPAPEPTVKATATETETTTTTTLPAAEAPARPVPGAPAWGVNVGLFASPDNAQRAHQRLLQAQLPATVEVLRGDKGERFRVRVGPFDKPVAAEAAAQSVRALGLDAVVFSTP